MRPGKCQYGRVTQRSLLLAKARPPQRSRKRHTSHAQSHDLVHTPDGYKFGLCKNIAKMPSTLSSPIGSLNDHQIMEANTKLRKVYELNLQQNRAGSTRYNEKIDIKQFLMAAGAKRDRAFWLVDVEKYRDHIITLGEVCIGDYAEGVDFCVLSFNYGVSYKPNVISASGKISKKFQVPDNLLAAIDYVKKARRHKYLWTDFFNDDKLELMTQPPDPTCNKWARLLRSLYSEEDSICGGIHLSQPGYLCRTWVIPEWFSMEGNEESTYRPKMSPMLKEIENGDKQLEKLGHGVGLPLTLSCSLTLTLLCGGLSPQPTAEKMQETLCVAILDQVKDELNAEVMGMLQSSTSFIVKMATNGTKDGYVTYKETAPTLNDVGACMQNCFGRMATTPDE